MTTEQEHGSNHDRLLAILRDDLDTLEARHNKTEWKVFVLLMMVLSLLLILFIPKLYGQTVPDPAWIETPGSRILRAEVAFPVYAESRERLLALCLERSGIFGESMNEEKQRVYYHCTLPNAPAEPAMPKRKA